ncbi:MAG: GreA/GreB family elongation factor [Leptospirales bacterium]|nr:GreA/GreB family elongation factor [Leptospirales bacterium]
MAKNIFTSTWNYDWLDYPEENLVLSYFRLMNELKKIEVDGNRLKNIMTNIICDDNYEALKRIVDRYDSQLVGKIFDIFENLPYIEKSQFEKFEEIVKSRFDDIQSSGGIVEEEWKSDIEKLIVSKEGYDRKKAELDQMGHVVKTELSNELSGVADASSDIRENVDYNTLLEKQSVLQLAISRLEEEMKRADILDPEKINTDCVNIGTKVLLSGQDSSSSYTILGPWDADFEKGILSYRSPIAKAILGKRVGDDVSFRIDDKEQSFKIMSIERYI